MERHSISKTFPVSRNVGMAEFLTLEGLPLLDPMLAKIHRTLVRQNVATRTICGPMRLLTIFE
jgi:hypothetical protein